jgi:hypothetical protein
MEIELVPDPGTDDAAALAALRALDREGLAAEPVPPGVTSAWRRAGLDGAMNRELDPGGSRPGGRSGTGAAMPRTARRA